MEQRNNWILSEIRNVELKDKRLNKRYIKVAKALSKNPSQSIGQAFKRWGETKGAYRFFAHEDVTREALLKPHIEETIKRCEKKKEVVVIEDTSYLNMSAHKATEGLGPIRNKGDHQMGLIVHTMIAVDGETGETEGVLGQEVWARAGFHDRGKTNKEQRFAPRESECWQRGIDRLHDIGFERRAILVCDRGSDIYEVLAKAVKNNQRFVIRSNSNRALTEKKKHLFEAVRKSNPIGTYEVDIPSKQGQKARKALMYVRSTTVEIRASYLLPRSNPSVTINVVEAYEQHAPKGYVPLHWILLSNEPNATFDECIRIIQLYTYRWKIEEFHMGLKTGCHIEERQFKTSKRIEAFLGLSSIMSIMLLRLRDKARTKDSFDHGLTAVEIALLRQEFPKLGRNPNIRNIVRAIAQLGGFLGRKSDGEPGWRTLLRGMHELLVMEHGFYLAKDMLALSSTPS
jgi:hypothetical protein